MSEKVEVPVKVRVPWRGVNVPELDQVPPTVTPQEAEEQPEALTSKVPAVMVRLLEVVKAAPKVTVLAEPLMVRS